MKDLLRQLRWLALIILGGLVGVFILQNAARVELQFLTWTISTRRALLVVLCVAIGYVLGWLFGYTAKRH